MLAAARAGAEDPRLRQVLDLINDERVRRGLPTLVSHPLLARAAQAHSMDMADNDFFAHRGSDGASFAKRFLRNGYEYSFAAENISAGLASAAETVEAWMASEPHRINILSPDARDVGVGFVARPEDGGKVRYRYYWTLAIGQRMPHGARAGR